MRLLFLFLVAMEFVCLVSLTHQIRGHTTPLPLIEQHRTSFRLPSRAPCRAPLIYFWLFEKKSVSLHLENEMNING